MGRCLSCHMDRCWKCDCYCHTESPKYKALEEANERAAALVSSAIQAVEPLPETRAELRRREEAADLNNRKILLANGRCMDHRRYEAKRRPRASCEWCWALWLKKKGLA